LDFRDALKERLVAYKRRELRVREDGTWGKQAYPHILPDSLGHLNLIAPIRDDCLAYIKATRIKLHQYFHHLNSSQAFAFNLFFPLFNGGSDCVSALLDAIGVSGDLRKWAFEAIPDREEGTNFDFLLELVDGRRIYGEVKLTESGFGTARPNERRRLKRTQIYLPRLEGKVHAETLDESTFFRRYQLLRNISYVNEPEGSELLLVFPRANREALRESDELVEILDPSIAHLVRTVDAGDLVSRLLIDPRVPPATLVALEELNLKYGLLESAET
jgi:hypothetical protein